MQFLPEELCKNRIGGSAKIAQVPPDETRQEEGPREGDNHRITTSITKNKIDMPPSAGAHAPLVDREKENEEEQEEQPDLVTLRTEYATLSQQLEQLDMHKQAGQWARLYKQVHVAEERLRLAEQHTPPSPSSPSESATSAEYARQSQESAKLRTAPASEAGATLPSADDNEVDGRQVQLRAIASDLLYWKGGLKVLKQARLPKWRGCFQWQIEAKIEALQAEVATLRAEVAEPDD